MKSRAQIIGQRAELLVELFVQDFKPHFVAKPIADIGYDLILGFRNSKGGINNFAVEIKATEKTLSSSFRLPIKVAKFLAYSNIPALLFVVETKTNRISYAWVTPKTLEENERPNSVLVRTKLLDPEESAALSGQFVGQPNLCE